MTTSDPADADAAQAAEVARLRAEIAQLKGENPDVTPQARRGWWRPVVATVLVFVAALLAPLSVLATWASGQISETDRYLATVAPLAEDPDVQQAIANRIEQVIFSYLDVNAAMDEVVGALEDQGLPPQAAATLDALSGPLASGIQSFVRERIDALVQSDAFADAWTEANRVAHAELVSALLGEGDGAVTVDRGTVSVNVATLINTVKQQLVDAGFGIADRIPEVAASFVLIQSDDLGKLQNLLGLLDNLSTWLPIIALALIAAAVVLSRDRRKWILASGLAVLGSMLLLGVMLNAIRPIYLDALPASSSAAAAGAVYDQLVSFIRMALRGVAVVALAVAVAAWLSAPRGAGAGARRGLVHGIDGLRHGTTRAGLRTGKLGVVLGQYRAAIFFAVAGVAAVLYLAQDHPTGSTALWFVLGTVAVLLVVAVLANPDAAEDPDAADQTVPAVPSGTS